MGRHRADRPSRPAAPGERTDTVRGTADPERRELVEPDREGARRMPADEQDARARVHTDRDPVDDIDLAASGPRDVPDGDPGNR